MNIETILKLIYPPGLVDVLLTAYKDIESNYALRKWKASELDAGHFVEAVRRIIDDSLFSSYVPIDTKLPNFTDAELKRYELGVGDESLRLLIPRALKAIYNIRNKRGVGHIGKISPNEMDATYILYSAKWILADLIRIASNSTADDAQKIIDEVVERRLSVLWKHEGVTRVLASGLDARAQILVLLYDENSQSEDSLRKTIEYKHASNFRKILIKLHTNRFIEFQRGNPLVLTTKGLIEAEQILSKLK